MGWPGGVAGEITTERLRLTPLAVEDAAELVDVLDDARLHQFIGGEPATLADLEHRYRAMVAGPGRDDEAWLNWVVRRRADGAPLGTVQATLRRDGTTWTADVAWVVGVASQGQGFASEAARGLVAWLQEHGVARIGANIHPDHHASAGVARHAGLHPTDRELDGETVWELG